MNEMEPEESKIDRLLRASMAAPAPELPADFERRVMLGVQRNERALEQGRRILLVGYSLTSAFASAVVMRGQGLDWAVTSGLILGPIALVGAAWWVWRANSTSLRRGAPSP